MSRTGFEDRWEKSLSESKAQYKVAPSPEQCCSSLCRPSSRTVPGQDR